MFTALGIYAESFEKPFVERTSEFYAAEGVKYMQQSDVPDYLKHVEVCFLCFLFPYLFVNLFFLSQSNELLSDHVFYSRGSSKHFICTLKSLVGFSNLQMCFQKKFHLWNQTVVGQFNLHKPTRLSFSHIDGIYY